jgi:hypothetical protein
MILLLQVTRSRTLTNAGTAVGAPPKWILNRHSLIYGDAKLYLVSNVEYTEGANEESRESRVSHFILLIKLEGSTLSFNAK